METVVLTNPIDMHIHLRQDELLRTVLPYSATYFSVIPGLAIIITVLAFNMLGDGLRDALILEMLYSSGVRVSELANMKLNDIDFKERKILILGKGNKERYVYYGSKCAELLDKYLKLDHRDSPYLLIGKRSDRLNEREIRSIVTDTAKKAGIEVHVSPHTLRHTYATHMLNDGADLKSVGDLLGHESLSTTQIYTHVSNERLRQVYLSAHPRAHKN